VARDLIVRFSGERLARRRGHKGLKWVEPIPRERQMTARQDFCRSRFARPGDPPAEHDDDAAADHRSPCPCCGGRMIIIEIFERGGAP
jgi:hypothetical protein